jgi:phospholipid/cholesterol/gamma-HCH transport system ATP-binding protein
MKREKIISLELKDLDFFYDPQKKIFDNVNFRFEKSEVLYLQGPRGAGKKSLIKLLLGLTTPNVGEYLINGSVVNGLSFTEFTPLRLNMGYAFDVGGLINTLTMYQNFRLILDYHDFLEASEREDYIVQLMKRFRIHELKDMRPAHVSSSTRKAANLMKAFLLKPEMVILNDPTQGLSQEDINPLVELIREHQEKHSLKFVIISSNDSELTKSLEGRAVNVTPKGFFDLEVSRRAS